MCIANAKPAAIQRLWHMLIRKAGKHGLPRPALFISRRSNAIGSNGAQATGETSCQSNCDKRAIEALERARMIEARLRRQAQNTPAKVIRLRAEKHAILNRGV